MNSNRSAREPGRLRTAAATAAAVVAACTMAVATGCDSSVPKPPASPGPAHATARFPGTPAGQQARWLLSAMAHPPIPVSAIKAHFDATFLRQVPAARLDSVFAQVQSLRLDTITKSTPGILAFVVTANGTSRLTVSMATDARGLISGLLLRPAGASTTAVPTNWPGVDTMIRSVAPQVRFLVAAVHGSTCRPVDAIGATTPAPLGSAFKLYVLDALARAVAAGTVRWDQSLTVTSQVKSLPSGVLQNDPDGTRVSVLQVATDMISISDNTAANMLIALLGRHAVEAAARASGMADPALDVPFLTTRELFVLKLHDWPELAEHYLALGAAGRRALLSGTVDRVPLGTLPTAGWTGPRDIGSLEWFASPADICQVFASLARQPGLAPLAGILERNAGGLRLDPSRWQPVWFKGGSEPGVLSLSYLARTRTGQAYVASVLAENPAAPLAQNPAILTLTTAVKGALQLAAGRA